MPLWMNSLLSVRTLRRGSSSVLDTFAILAVLFNEAGQKWS